MASLNTPVSHLTHISALFEDSWVSVPLLITALGIPNLPRTGRSFCSVTVLTILKHIKIKAKFKRKLKTELNQVLESLDWNLAKACFVFISNISLPCISNVCKCISYTRGSAVHLEGNFPLSFKRLPIPTFHWDERWTNSIIILMSSNY